MSKNRNIADLLDANGDVKSTHLDNVPAVDLTNLNASHLTSGSIPDARVPSSAVSQHATSFDDNQIQTNLALLSFKSSEQISGYKQDIEKGTNPRDIKFLLAEEIVERFHEGLGKKSKDNFINRFQKGNISQDLEELSISIDSDSELVTRILKESNLLASTSEAIRLIKQGAIKVNDEKVVDTKFMLKKGTSNLVQVGKKKAATININ